MFNADNNKAVAQQKFDAAQAAKGQADTDDASAVSSFNASLDALIAAATAAKIPPPSTSTAIARVAG
jgi:hypothetical protein